MNLRILHRKNMALHAVLHNENELAEWAISRFDLYYYDFFLFDDHATIHIIMINEHKKERVLDRVKQAWARMQK